MKNPGVHVAVVLALAAACGNTARSQTSDALLACSKIQDAGERVRCYDAQVAAMNHPSSAAAAPATHAGAASAPPIAAVPAASPVPATHAAAGSASAAAAMPAVASTAKPAESRFGEEDLPRAQQHQDRPDVLLSDITAIRVLGGNGYAIVLANGQTWRHQGGIEVKLFYRVGDQVRIERGALGSYHMSTSTTGAKNWLQVIRVQ